MKFVSQTTENGLRIKTGELITGSFSNNAAVDVHVEEGVIVVLKHKMKAMELINAAYALQKLADNSKKTKDIQGDSCWITLMMSAVFVSTARTAAPTRKLMSSAKRSPCPIICERKPGSRKAPSFGPV